MWSINKMKLYFVKLVQTMRMSEHLTRSFTFGYLHLICQVFLLMVLCGSPPSLLAQSHCPGFKIFQTNSDFYPFVRVYFRYFEENQRPPDNMNEKHIVLVVKGYRYDPEKQQYIIQSGRQSQEAVGSVIVLDASGSMKGEPFEAAVRTSTRYIKSKRSQDQIAVLAIRDTTEGYEVISPFESDSGTLERRIADLTANGQKTRLYDSINEAMDMCKGAQGIVSCAIVVFSDGHDEGSALKRGELMDRIDRLDLLPISIRIYSVAIANRHEQQHLTNLEAISPHSYYGVDYALARPTKVVEEIQGILQNYNVLTFRSYIDSDDLKHSFRLGVEYDSRSCYESAQFEATKSPPPLDRNSATLKERLNKIMPDFEPNQAGNPNQ